MRHFEMESKTKLLSRGFSLLKIRMRLDVLLFQLYLVRTMLESVIDVEALRKKMDPHHVTRIKDFHRLSFFWHYLINFNSQSTVFSPATSVCLLVLPS